MPITFDTLAYMKKLEAAGFSRAQAEVQAEAFRVQAEAQEASRKKTFSEFELHAHKELATREDFLTLRTELQSMRGEIWRLDNQLITNKHEILKWVVRTMIGLAAFICSVIGMGVAFLMK
ncbi:MAG: hypothetical protein HDQ91_00375 [Desulfovibrio sp.]|nr:hypothetical protein [Desulfovibrio sp.]